MPRSNVSHRRLLDTVSYDRQTGEFVWKEREGDVWFNSRFSGKTAGTTRVDGYKTICVDRVQYLSHRLAWFYVHREWPEFHVDHIDRDPSNNAISNLRAVTSAENTQNQNRKLGRSGVTGVHRAKDRWVASGYHKKKKVTFGTYDTIEEASTAYQNGVANIESMLAEKHKLRAEHGKQRVMSLKGGRSGVRGVVANSRGRWMAVGRFHGKRVYFGTYESIDAAKTAYDEGISRLCEIHGAEPPPIKLRNERQRELTHAALLELLVYDPDTGQFRDRKSSRLLGHSQTGGYTRIRVSGKRYSAHHLVIFYVTGAWPTRVVDHINGSKIDNRFANLREVTASENALNKRDRRSPARGVRKGRNKNDRWEAAITIDGIRHHIGTYDTESEAKSAWNDFVFQNDILRDHLHDVERPARTAHAERRQASRS